MAGFTRLTNETIAEPDAGADSRQPLCLRVRWEIRRSLFSLGLCVGRLRLGFSLSGTV